MNIDFGPLIVAAMVGYFAFAMVAGATAGALLAMAFALYWHDFSILIWPSIAGALTGAALMAWSLFAPRR